MKIINNSDEAAMKALVKKIDDNKAKIMMALSYLNRYITLSILTTV